ncbi:P-loop containing nucleoside triphosphate hydrolase protein [Immersiella caudata]|uniref:P-loop containing nucleoside triphosphate hydrolase protein n=1 Tax=Immersiella caudata TaxID=314043 RepID=A0AA39WCY9_9PEZI|nr:P-loop containing nucleoside triphosphate hydrolase protein [Immersiella caudata]
MKSILSRFFNHDPLPNISIMGLEGAGKTTLLYKLSKSRKVIDTFPTIGLHIQTSTIQPCTRFTARVADAGGCGRMYSLVRYAMLEAPVVALVWVVDVNDTDQLSYSVDELERLLFADFDKGGQGFAPSIPIMVLANKVDLHPSQQILGKIRSEFEKLLKNRHWAFFETSSIATPWPEASGLEAAFTWLNEAVAPPKIETLTEAKKKPVEDVLSDMRSPAALSAKLESWLSKAEEDPVTAEHLLNQFEALDLPSWDHYTHLRLAYILLLKYGRRVGKDKIFDGFKDYIDKSGKVHGKSFHMTMTYFWVQMVHLGVAGMQGLLESHTLQAADANEEEDPNPSPLDDFAHFLAVNSYLVDGQLWADYYSKEVLMSPEAKQGVQFPDIKKLPDVLYPTKTEKVRIGENNGMCTASMMA